MRNLLSHDSETSSSLASSAWLFGRRRRESRTNVTSGGVSMPAIIRQHFAGVSTTTLPAVCEMLPAPMNHAAKHHAAAIAARNLTAWMAMHPILNTPAAVAKRAGIAERTVRNIRAGAHAQQLDKLEAVAGAFNKPVWELLFDADLDRERLFSRLVDPSR